MDTAVQAWLFSQLGRGTDLADLQLRYTRLGTARAVALEVLGERLAEFIDSPGSVTVSGVVAVNFGANIAALERKIALLRDGIPVAPDEDDPDDDGVAGDDGFGVMYLTERPRR